MAELTILKPPAAVGLRGDGGPAFAAAVLSATGLALPGQANTFVGDSDRCLLWLGPDEWLLLDEAGDGGTLEGELRQALAGQTASICDVSGNRALLRVTGADAVDFLSHGCALDPASFIPGLTCVQTLVARAQVILLCRADDRIDILPRRSFAHYLHSWLLTAAAGR